MILDMGPSALPEALVEDQIKPSWRQWIEPWYLVYALMGAVIAGLIPVILPLAAIKIGSVGQVGLIVAAVNLGGLTAPVWGWLADRYRLHRWLLVAGLLVSAVGSAMIALTALPRAWLGLSLLLGVGAASSATVANLFVIETHPRSEWDERIGWLQAFYGAGQVVGLFLAGALSQVSLRSGLVVSAGLMAVAALLGWLTTSLPPTPSGAKPVLLHPARHGDWVVLSPQRLFHHLDLHTIRLIGPSLRSPFGIFILAWLLATTGAAAVFSQYPLLMQQSFGITSGISSLAFALVAGVGLALYTPAGHWSEQHAPARVLRVGLGLRLLAFSALLYLSLAHFTSRSWLAILSFALVVLAWSLLIVGGTALAARLSPASEGEGLGVFNAATALANVFGAVAGGWVAGRWGYSFLSLWAVIGISLGLVISFTLHSGNMPKES
jgi:MFS transporter, DHA1 family, tetracycline resistance protein